MTDFLTEVAASTRERIDVQKAQRPEAALRKEAKPLAKAHSFQKALKPAGKLAVIAELKQASPSAGLIRKEDNIEGRIQGYERGGAHALSILTEEKYFHGSPHLLSTAGSASHLPLLRKDFIIDIYQVYESRMLGAHAILLIAALLNNTQIESFTKCAHELGMDVLLEVHDENEIARVLPMKPAIVGVNNRNLRTLRVDLSVGLKMLPLVKKSDAITVAESGIRTAEDVKRFQEKGADAILVGETLMRNPDAEAAVRDLLKGASA